MAGGAASACEESYRYRRAAHVQERAAGRFRHELFRSAEGGRFHIQREGTS